jgi:hypothetical protein
MLDRVFRTVSRLRIFSLVLLTMAFAVPAFESHACAAQAVDVTAASEQFSTQTGADPCEGCPDCGPACAGGCCHAPHPGMAADVMDRQTLVTFQRPSTWAHVLRAPMDRPSGPERPPRP